MDWLKLYKECERAAVIKDISLASQSKTPFCQKPKRVILSMWEEHYLKGADILQAGLTQAYGEDGIARWTSDLVSRQELCIRLATHRIPLAFYLGHGREQGWSGYRGLRIHHLHQPAEPMGLIVSLSCNTLDFGRQLIEEGYVQAFLGSEQSMKVSGVARLVCLFSTVFYNKNSLLNTANDLLEITEEYVSLSNSKELHEVWSQLKFLGSGTTNI